jgi:hypothetical protein
MAMSRFEAEPRATKPTDFDPWLEELGLLADTEGAQALLGIIWYAPVECLAYLVTVPGLWAGLLARSKYADLKRFYLGVAIGLSQRLET